MKRLSQNAMTSIWPTSTTPQSSIQIVCVDVDVREVRISLELRVKSNARIEIMREKATICINPFMLPNIPPTRSSRFRPIIESDVVVT